MIKNTKAIAVIIVMLAFGGFAKFFVDNSNRKIKSNGKVTSAYVISVERALKPTPPAIKYYYVINNDTIYSVKYVEFSFDFRKIKCMEGKMQPVIYDSTNVRSSMLIINESDYK